MSKDGDIELTRLHREAPLLDLHADSFSIRDTARSFVEERPYRHLDLPRMLEAGILGEAFSIFVHPRWVPEAEWYSRAVEILEKIHAAIELSPKLRPATSSDDIRANAKDGAVSAIIEMEGLHPMAGRIERIEEFFSRGVRIFTLTWNNSNPWATSCDDDMAMEKGLTVAGREAVAEINRLGGLVDFSHSGEATFWETLEILEKPPLCTHSCCRALKDSSRNLTDDQIRAIAKAGGVIGINFFPGFLSSKKYSRVTPADVADHIEHIFELGGESCAALGSDFDGIQCLPGMEDCRGVGKITAELSGRGFSEGDILNVLGRNFLRIFE